MNAPVNISATDKRRAQLIAECDGDIELADAETQGRLAYLDGRSWNDNPAAEWGLPFDAQSSRAISWADGFEQEQRLAERARRAA